ncbi:hypothetical protein B0H13DRAFT_1906858 [Mycena leptocephala]|nr:hypothetical protein B0H13DRAFT_1906858 [Mycena leptocephala]
MLNKIWEVDARNMLRACLEMQMQQLNLHCAENNAKSIKRPEMLNKIWEVDARNMLRACLEMQMQQLNLHCAENNAKSIKRRSVARIMEWIEHIDAAPVFEPEYATTSRVKDFHTSAIRLCHNATPTIPGLNFPADGYARLAQEILKLAPGATTQLRTTKETRCGVENAEQFVFKPTASAEEVQSCEEGYMEVQPDDYRFYLGPGYLQARWNLVVLNKIVDAAMIEGQHLAPVPQEWLLQQLTGQMKGAREAWARPQPRGNETAAEGIAHANQYHEERAVNTRGNSAKSRKFNNREHIIEVIIKLKTGTKAPDVEAWKRILEMLLHLGNDGMSSEEDFEEIRGKTKWTGYKVKICAWHAQEVDDILVMVDSMGEKLSKGKFGPPGPKRLPRERSDEASDTGAPKGLPECLYDARWIARESKKSPVFYADLAVSKEAFYLLAASADMVE